MAWGLRHFFYLRLKRWTWVGYQRSIGPRIPSSLSCPRSQRQTHHPASSRLFRRQNGCTDEWWPRHHSAIRIVESVLLLHLAAVVNLPIVDQSNVRIREKTHRLHASNSVIYLQTVKSQTWIREGWDRLDTECIRPSIWDLWQAMQCILTSSVAPNSAHMPHIFHDTTNTITPHTGGSTIVLLTIVGGASAAGRVCSPPCRFLIATHAQMSCHNSN